MSPALPPDSNCALFAQPLEADIGDTPSRILILPQKGDPASAAGGGLACLAHMGGQDYGYQARLIRALGSNPLKLLGIFRSNAEGGRLPSDRVVGHWALRG